MGTVLRLSLIRLLVQQRSAKVIFQLSDTNVVKKSKRPRIICCWQRPFACTVPDRTILIARLITLVNVISV